ncbi:transcription termination/antitermination protein NusG [Ponticoccus litoralis]|uniref:Transcription termination/antitermination NusG family protein n=1 Tax=Ponticoccus litoralis TaxID=422297 RepID=A0AAW9SKP1_9RHOB
MTYHIGQIEKANLETWGRRPIFLKGAPGGGSRWHALTVPPQKEDAAEAWLKLRGVYSFHPVTRRTTKLRGKVIERESRYLPGLVFASFPGVAVRSRVTDCPFITGAITLKSGHWGIIVPDDIRRLHAMRSIDDEQKRQRSEAAKIRKGDRVRVLSGLLGEGQEVEVFEIRAGRARFKLHMFGAEINAEADIDRLHKLG